MNHSQKQHSLITGVPYSGKSYICHFLQQQGSNAVEADDVAGLAQWVNKSGDVVTFPNDANTQWLDSHTYLWNKKFLHSWLDTQTEPVYLFGFSNNVLDCIDLFDTAYYLNLSPQVLKNRFSQNERNNPMGKTTEQQQVLLSWMSNFAQKAQNAGLTFLEADQSPERIHQILTQQ